MKNTIRDLAVSPDSKFIAVSTIANDLLLYNVTSSRALTLTHTSTGHRLAFSADSTQLITSDDNGSVQAWDVNTGKLLTTYIEQETPINSLAVSPALIAVGLVDRIALIDISTGERLSDLEAPGNHQSLAFNAAGTWLATGNSTGQISLWKYDNGQFAEPLSLNEEPASAMSFNPNGDILAIGTLRHVYLVDTQSGREIARIPHASNVNAVSFSPDGMTLAAASGRVIQFWQVANIKRIESSQIVETACSRLIQNFGESEWSAFFGDQPYKKLCEDLP
jgi:WD40 repeat protein